MPSDAKQSLWPMGKGQSSGRGSLEPISWQEQPQQAGGLGRRLRLPPQDPACGLQAGNFPVPSTPHTFSFSPSGPSLSEQPHRTQIPCYVAWYNHPSYINTPPNPWFKG